MATMVTGLSGMCRECRRPGPASGYSPRRELQRVALRWKTDAADVIPALSFFDAIRRVVERRRVRTAEWLAGHEAVPQLLLDRPG
jgi:hypothetical protein